MSSFKNAAGAIDEIRLQATGKKNLEESTIADFLSIAGYEDPAGGGGDSDISIAEVTFVRGTYTSGDANIKVSCLYEEDVSMTSPDVTLISGVDSIDAKIILYKGAALTYVPEGTVFVGDNWDSDLWEITGSGTITINNE